MNFLADVSFSAEAITIIGSLGAGLLAAIALLFKLLLASKDKQLADMTSSRDSFKEIAEESVTNVEQIVNRMRAAKGQKEFKRIKPVVPEHASPVTRAQQDTAELQTLRAKLVAATLDLDLPAREAPRAATPEEEKKLQAGGRLPADDKTARDAQSTRETQATVAAQTAIAASAVASAAELASTAAQTAADAADAAHAPRTRATKNEDQK